MRSVASVGSFAASSVDVRTVRRSEHHADMGTMIALESAVVVVSVALGEPFRRQSLRSSARAASPLGRVAVDEPFLPPNRAWSRDDRHIRARSSITRMGGQHDYLN